MSAALHLVPESNTPAGGNEADQVDDWQGRTVAARWNPENQLLGALMWMPCARARTFLELIPDTAIWLPANRWVYELVGRIVTAGRDPDPVTVLAYARQHAATQALNAGQRPTASQHHRLALHLADLYTHTVSPAHAAEYAREVLDEAYRRAVSAHGIRLQQLAETGVARTELTEQMNANRAELADLWRRADAAAQTDWDQP